MSTGLTIPWSEVPRGTRVPAGWPQDGSTYRWMGPSGEIFVVVDDITTQGNPSMTLNPINSTGMGIWSTKIVSNTGDYKQDTRDIEALIAKLTDVEARMTKAEREVDAHSARISVQESALEAQEKQIKDLRDQLTEIKDAKDTLRSLATNLKEQNEVLTEEVERLEDELADAQEKLPEAKKEQLEWTTFPNVTASRGRMAYATEIPNSPQNSASPTGLSAEQLSTLRDKYRPYRSNTGKS